MLPPFIIEQIRKREEEERRRKDERPALELPLDAPIYPAKRRDDKQEEDPERGVVIIDFTC